MSAEEYYRKEAEWKKRYEDALYSKYLTEGPVGPNEEAIIRRLIRTVFINFKLDHLHGNIYE